MFHGNGGSRHLPTCTWLKAEEKTVRDGIGTWYLSGWHVFLEYDIAKNYLRRFKKERPLTVIEVFAKKLRPKAHSKSGIYLAKWIWIL